MLVTHVSLSWIFLSHVNTLDEHRFLVKINLHDLKTVVFQVVFLLSDKIYVYVCLFLWVSHRVYNCPR